jgi:hypothetical protein
MTLNKSSINLLSYQGSEVILRAQKNQKVTKKKKHSDDPVKSEKAHNID